MPAYLRVGQSRGVVRCVPETAGVPDSDAGLRAANARLRELLAERETRAFQASPCIPGTG